MVHSSLSRLMVVAVAVALAILLNHASVAQKKETVWTTEEKPLADGIHGLRALPDDVRSGTTKDLALKIRQLPMTENRLRLAMGLAGLSTEGDFGMDTLTEVAKTLADTLRAKPVPGKKGEPADPYFQLATLVRYEHVQVSMDDPQFAEAMARLEADDRKREHPEFTLKDLAGKQWKFSELRGHVVVVNFWATWCPPCRKEMPDLETLYERFQSKGLVVLAISDEDTAKVEPFIRERGVKFPVLLDPGRKVNRTFIVEGIPHSFVYDRDGNLVAQSMDMRTQKQFLEMLGKAWLE
jgi:peroxiredoxin